MDRAALERVLARAAELQSLSGDPADALTDEQILELGKEVGVSGQFLRQALAEERAGGVRSDARRGVLGTSTVSAERTVAGNTTDVLGAIDAWLQKDEWLQVKRQFADRLVWEPRRDIEGTIRRALNVGGRGYALSRANEVSATVVPMDDARLLVRLDADLAGHRRSVARRMVGVGTLGVLASAAAVAMNFDYRVAALPALLLIGAGYLGARDLHAHAVTRAQLTLEQLLDRLERGERAESPSLLKMLAAVARPTPRR